MKITRHFPRIFFQPAAIREAYDILVKVVGDTTDTIPGFPKQRLSGMNVKRGRDTITHDDEEQFFADYRNIPDVASYSKYYGRNCIDIHFYQNRCDVSVECHLRSQIDAVLNCFEEHALKSKLPEPKMLLKPKVPPIKPKVFVGHGHSGLWRELKDHLTDKHGFDVVAYEVGARAGHTIRDILEDMLNKSSIAVLVLTGEDKDADGRFHARENVVHETGLFQGRLGFARAIVALEQDTVEFSNIHGIDQLRFSKGNIKEIFGDLVAVIRREFGTQMSGG